MQAAAAEAGQLGGVLLAVHLRAGGGDGGRGEVAPHQGQHGGPAGLPLQGVHGGDGGGHPGPQVSTQHGVLVLLGSPRPAQV